MRASRCAPPRARWRDARQRASIGDRLSLTPCFPAQPAPRCGRGRAAWCRSLISDGIARKMSRREQMRCDVGLSVAYLANGLRQGCTRAATRPAESRPAAARVVDRHERVVEQEARRPTAWSRLPCTATPEPRPRTLGSRTAAKGRACCRATARHRVDRGRPWSGASPSSGRRGWRVFFRRVGDAVAGRGAG